MAEFAATTSFSLSRVLPNIIFLSLIRVILLSAALGIGLTVGLLIAKIEIY